MTPHLPSRDPGALEAELIGQLGWVRRLAASLVRDGDAAADIAQEVARDWVVRRPAWAERGLGLRRWLRRATRSRSVDHLRAERARRARECACATVPSVEDAQGVLDRLERQQRVAEAVASLPEPYRSTLLHRYLDELPTRTVAERTGVSEAAVRKRIERGLELLRARLDGEFGTDTRAWALLLLGPSWGADASVAPAAIGGGGHLATILQGAGLMVGKKTVVVAGSMVLAAAAVLWFANATADPARVEVGGRGVIVSESVAAAREAEAPRPERVEVGAPGPPATGGAAGDRASIRGFVFVDGQHRAPRDLSIAVQRPGRDDDAELRVQIDVAAGKWSMQPMPDEELTLWVTSSGTVPAQIPVPEQLVRAGGTFDLHLLGGRTLILSLLDEVTRTPLAGLEFELSKAIVLRRSVGSVLTRDSRERYRTDTEGRAVIVGVPESGAVSVITDLVVRERSVLMRDGDVARAQLQGEPIWSLWIDEQMPRQIEQTILCRAPLGEGWARGQVPAWARATRQATESGVRVVARRWSENARERGDAFAIDQDGDGCFVLREQAPQRFRVWLEAGRDREPISAPLLVTFDHAGEHAPIVLQPLDVFDVRVHCANVPPSGQLELLVSGTGTRARAQQFACAGKPLVLQVTAAAGEQLRLSLRAGADDGGEAAWQRQLAVDPGQREIHVDLAGAFRGLRIDSDVLDLRGEAAVALMACRNGQCSIDERIVVLLVDGRSARPVYVPAGRWLFHYSTGDAGVSWPHAVWGVVDVPAAGAEPLPLRPRLCLVPRHELQPGRRFDEIDGVSLRSLPERLRVWRPSPDGEPVAMPVGAVHTAIAAPR